jgi:hypothetical protein
LDLDVAQSERQVEADGKKENESEDVELDEVGEMG